MSENSRVLREILTFISHYHKDDAQLFSRIISSVNQEKDKLVLPKGNYRCEVSTGQGKNPICPWFGVFFENNSPTQGFYVVFLFDANQEFVFLSLSFGTEKLSLKQICAITRWAKDRLGENDWTDNQVDLKWKTGRPKKYEKSVILSKKIEIRCLPSIDLDEDFTRIMDYYQNLLMLCEIYDYPQLFREVSNNKKKKEIENVVEKDRRKRRMVSEEMLMDALLARKELGDMGEAFIKEIIEKEFLDKGYVKFEVKIQSCIDEGAGYDILAVWNDPNGIIKTEYYEVKTTTGSCTTPFYMSQNERSFCEQHPFDYFLYRVYQFREKSKPKGLFQKIEASNLIKNYSFRPMPYSFSVKKNGKD